MSRKKRPVPEKYIPSIRDIKVSLFSEYQWISLLSGRGKPYDHIIEGLLKIGDIWNSEDSDYENGAFTMKWMAEKLNEAPAHINKWIRAIYDDLFELNSQEPELFSAKGEILCGCWFSGYDKERSCHFNLGLPVLPHAGETLNFTFVRATLNCDYFYIKRISHNRDGGKTRITIECKVGTSYNQFREFMLDKALFMNEIGFMTEYEAPYNLDEMLQAYERNGHVPSVEEIIRERRERFKLWAEYRKNDNKPNARR